ncbi:hypothetical protein HMN09_01289500 [Mycena chlorophos]|uniref:Uncharacterized protein n=1 Tax=Mycena chlorophos TaxID=658473 RepID=A0A8H6RYY9_MYCCL|nr:hypothetical protein HMN09_01289500 [Mycena chlorophos]
MGVFTIMGQLYRLWTCCAEMRGRCVLTRDTPTRRPKLSCASRLLRFSTRQTAIGSHGRGEIRGAGTSSWPQRTTPKRGCHLHTGPRARRGLRVSLTMLDDVCTPHHDWFTAMLTFCLCIGLIISYLPQHFRIIHSGTSEGLSPWFLLLGSTSSAAGFLNMITVQHTQIRCCTRVSIASCVEATAGIVQVGLQWAMFSFIFVLYMIYFPPHLKVAHASELPPEERGKRARAPSRLWKQSLLLANVTIAHFAISAVLTLFLLLASPSPLNKPSQPLPFPEPTFPDDPELDTLPLPLARWALFLGVSSASLAVIQYMPQIAFTWQARLVGALSIPMMCVQSPGAVAMVLSIALRPGTNWTSWITFAVAGMMQFTLLSICIAWKLRQRRLQIDDFGNPLDSSSAARARDPEIAAAAEDADEEESVPGLVVGEEEDAVAVRKALESALGEAVAADVREGTELEIDETTPLLGQSSGGASASASAEQDKQDTQAKGRSRWW